MKRLVVLSLMAAAVLALSTSAHAVSSYKTSFNTTYGTAGSAIDSCSICHTSAPALNAYGNAYLASGYNFKAIESADSDGDGFSNIAEITARTFPGNAASKPVASDTTAPTVTSFTVPATATSLTVTGISAAASDNVGVTGYRITESATAPAAGSTGWTASVPASYTFTTAGAKTLYAYAKDAAGNVSAGRSASVTITIPTADTTAPTVSSFTVPATASSLTISGINLTATDNVSVTGYKISESSSAPTSGWSATPPSAYTFSSTGTKTLYAFARDAAGNVSAGRSASVTVTVVNPDPINVSMSVFKDGVWRIDHNGDGVWDRTVDITYHFGKSGDIPVAGDWTGDGTLKIGVFRKISSTKAVWLLDMNGNGVWDEGVDAKYVYGKAGDIPVVGDWNGDGKTEIGVFRKGLWLIDTDGNGAWDPAVDLTVRFGKEGQKPVVGDWNGDGRSKIGVFSKGTWILDNNGDGIMNTASSGDEADDDDGDYDAGDQTPSTGTDLIIKFGHEDDKPVTGDWDNSGVTRIGTYRAGKWTLDIDGNGKFDPSIDKILKFGGSEFRPVSTQ